MLVKELKPLIKVLDNQSDATLTLKANEETDCITVTLSTRDYSKRSTTQLTSEINGAECLQLSGNLTIGRILDYNVDNIYNILCNLPASATLVLTIRTQEIKAGVVFEELIARVSVKGSLDYTIVLSSHAFVTESNRWYNGR